MKKGDIVHENYLTEPGSIAAIQLICFLLEFFVSFSLHTCWFKTHTTKSNPIDLFYFSKIYATNEEFVFVELGWLKD